MHKLTTTISLPILKHLSKGYVAGDFLDDAMRVANDVQELGHGVTLNYWHADQEDAQSVEAKYRDAIIACQDANLNFFFTIKTPVFGQNLSSVTKISETILTSGGSVYFDSHAPEHVDGVFEIARSIGGIGLACTIPGRWLRSIEDVHRANELGMRVRVVKGSWADPLAPNINLRQGYLKIIDVIAGKNIVVGVATHDDWLAEESMKRLRAKNTMFEQELLYGLPMKKVDLVGRKYNTPLRISIPFGSAWIPYSIKRSLTNPRTLKWLAKDLFKTQPFSVPPNRHLFG